MDSNTPRLAGAAEDKNETKKELMKTNKISWLAIVAAGSLLAFSPGLRAADGQDAKEVRRRTGQSHGGHAGAVGQDVRGTQAHG